MAGGKEDPMEPVLPETPTGDDTEFDLDVRLQAVARNVSAELRNEKPGPEGTVVSCLNTESPCGCKD